MKPRPTFATVLIGIISPVVVLVPLRINATTYLVGPSRNDTNLQVVVNRLAPGDLVEVDGNVTYPGNLTLEKSGTAAQPIIIRGMRIEGKRPIISGVKGIAGAVVRLRGDHQVFEGFEITAGGDVNARRGIYNLGNNVVVRDCPVRDCPTGVSGAAVAGSFTLDGVEIHRCGAGTKDHQIYVASDNTRHPKAVFRMQFCFLHAGAGGNNVKSRVGRNELYFNWIEGAYYHELDLIGADPSEQRPDTACLVREDSDVVGNIFYKRASSRGSVARCGTDGTGSSNGRFRFVNNTAVFAVGWDAGAGVFKLQGDRQSVEMHNNVFYRMEGGLILVRESIFPRGKPDRITGSRNWVTSGSTAIPGGWTDTMFGKQPDFVNLSQCDFTPVARSPLCDKALLPTTSPANFPFVSPLQTLQSLPPPRGQPGLIRARPVNGVVDIGAVESPPK